MRKRTLAPYPLNDSQISQQSLLSHSSSSRSFITNIPHHPNPTQSNLPSSQLHLIETLNLKFSINESPTEIFVNLLTNKIDQEKILEQCEAENRGKYQEAVDKETQREYLKMKEVSEIEYIGMREEGTAWESIKKSVILFCKHVQLLCQTLLSLPLFEVITTLVIIGNSIVIAASDPLSHNPIEQDLEIFFLSFYIFEAVVKISAYGLITKKEAYLRDLWNVLDLFIIMASVAQFFTYVGFSANSLRIFRVLRPLRTITKVSSLKMVIKTLFASLPLVFDSIVLLAIAIIIFSIFGMQLYGGLLKYRCMDIATGVFTHTLCSSTQSCAPFGPTSVCSKGISSPNHSIQNFDSISWAFISIFQILTMQGWSEIMLDLERAFNITGAIYTVAIIFVCELALLNITLAILKYKFSEIREKEMDPPVVQIEGYEIKDLKKIGAYQHFSNIKKGTFVPDILLDRIGATKLSKHPLFTPSLPPKKPSNIYQNYNRISSETRSVRNLMHYSEPNRPSNSKNIRIFDDKSDEIVGGGEYRRGMIDIKEIEFRVEEDEYWKDCEADPLIESLHELELEEEIKTQKLVDNNNAEGEEWREAQQKNALMFSLINSVGEQKNLQVDKPEIKQFIQNMRENNFIWNFKPEDNTASRNQEFLEIVMHRRKMNEFLNSSSEKPTKPAKDKKPRSNARKSIQQLRKQKEMDLDDIKLASEISKKHLYFQISKQPSLLHLFSSKSQQILLPSLHPHNHPSKKQLSIQYPNIWEKQKLLGIIKIPLRPIISRGRRTNRIINTHFMTDENHQEQEEIIDEMKGSKLETTPKEMFKITFKKKMMAGKGLKHRFSRRSVVGARVYTLEEIDKMYFLNRGSVSPEQEFQDRTFPTHLDTIKESPLPPPPSQTNEQKWNRICIEPNILQTLSLPYPPLDILTSPAHHFTNPFPPPTSYNIYIPGFFGPFRLLRNYLTILIQSTAYDNIILTLVILNTLVLTTNDNFSPSFQSNFNLIFTFLFTLDIVLKTIVYGLNFFEDFLNIFDLLVVLLSLFELIIIGESSANIAAFRSIRIFRVFRVLRMARLIRSMSFMSVISDIVAGVFYEFIYIFLLLGLFMFVYVLLGMQIFGGSFVREEISGVRQNFDSFGEAFFAIFQLITVENWNDIENALILSSTNSASIIFLMAGIFIGNWVLLNLVQAILLENFQIQRIKLKEQKQQKNNKNAVKTTEYIDCSNITDSIDISRSRQKSATFSKTHDKTNQSRTHYTIMMGSHDYSWWLFKPSNTLRRACLKIVSSKFFTYFMYFMIVISCGKLIFDTYINHDDSLLQLISSNINLAINICFFLEFVLKTIALGFIFSPTAYLKDNWNRLDFFIVICSVLDFFSASSNLGILKVFRALRPLKLISRNLRMRVMIQALFQSANGLANVGIVVLLVFLMFGILYMNLLGEKLDYCDMGRGEVYGPYGVDRGKCLEMGYVWRTRIINFENIVNSLISLYIFSTRQNWPFYHYSFVDAHEEGPTLNNNPTLFLFLSFIFIFICSYFLLDLFIGVIFLNYHMAEAKLNPKILTPEQTNWIKLQTHIISTSPYFLLYSPPTNPLKQKLYNLLKHKYYEITISILLGINTVVFMMEYDDMEVNYSLIILKLNCIFTSIFLLELVVKLGTFPVKEYFLSVFNVLESGIIVIGVIDFIQLAGYIEESALLDALKIIRIMRTFRLFRFIKTYKSLQKLVYILLYALPSIGYAASILCLYLLISSVISSTLFGNLIEDHTLMITPDTNFRDFHHALQMLFICLTGENWYYYMFASMDTEAHCADQESSCSSPYYIFFWLPFIFIGQKLIMELFVLLILDQFEDTFINENNPLGLFNDLEEVFRGAWVELAEKKGWTVKAARGVDLCLRLESPLGLGLSGELQKFQGELHNSGLTQQQTARKNYLFLSKMKQAAMKWVSKLELPNNILHYHRSFYLFAKAIFSPDPEHCTESQLLQLQQHQLSTIAHLSKIEGNSEPQNPSQQTMNPFKRQLLIQIALETWVNYSDMEVGGGEEKGEEDSIVMDEDMELFTLRVVNGEKEKQKENGKIKKATSIKLKRELSSGGSRIRDKDMPNPEKFYARKGRASGP